MGGWPWLFLFYFGRAPIPPILAPHEDPCGLWLRNSTVREKKQCQRGSVAFWYLVGHEKCDVKGLRKILERSVNSEKYPLNIFGAFDLDVGSELLTVKHVLESYVHVQCRSNRSLPRTKTLLVGLAQWLVVLKHWMVRIAEWYQQQASSEVLFLLPELLPTWRNILFCLLPVVFAHM